MDEFRLWWASVIKSFLSWMDGLVARLTYGVLHEWQLTYFVLGLGALLIIGMFTIWRRKA